MWETERANLDRLWDIGKISTKDKKWIKKTKKRQREPIWIRLWDNWRNFHERQKVNKKDKKRDKMWEPERANLDWLWANWRNFHERQKVNKKTKKRQKVRDRESQFGFGVWDNWRNFQGQENSAPDSHEFLSTPTPLKRGWFL